MMHWCLELNQVQHFTLLRPISVTFLRILGTYSLQLKSLFSCKIHYLAEVMSLNKISDHAPFLETL